MTNKQESRLWHCILCDELGDEFSFTLRAFDLDHAIESVRLSYPESGIVDIKPLG